MTPEEIQALEFSGSSDLAPTGEKKPPVSELEFTGVGEFPKAPPKDWGTVGEDVAKSATAKGALGIGDIAGLPGTAAKFITSDVPNWMVEKGIQGAEAADFISPNKAKALSQSITDVQKAFQSPTEQKGYSYAGLPTSEGMEKMITTVAPATAYEPKTTEGKYAGAVARAATPGIFGPVKTMTGRVVTGAISGLGSEAGGQYAEDHPAEPFARVAGALLGGAGGAWATRAIESSLMPTATAKNELARSLADGARRGTLAMTPEEIEAAIKAGTPVSVYDIADPATRNILSKYAALSPETEAAAAKLNKFLTQRDAAATARVSPQIEQSIGMKLDAAALTEEAEKQGKAIRDAVYKVARSDPKASSIAIAGLGDLQERPIFQKAMENAKETAKNNPDFKIIPPTEVAGKQAIPAKWQQTERGFVEVPAESATPAKVTHGNLSFYDQVKRELDAMEQMAIRQGDTTMESSVRSAREQLVKQLDTHVPSYAKARDVASDTFKAGSAPEAGQKFFGNMNDYKRKEITDALARYNPEQRKLFAAGVASKIDTAVQEGKLDLIAKKFITDNKFNSRMRLALGDDAYHSIKGKLISEHLVGKTNQLQFAEPSLGSGAKAGLSGVAGGVGLAGADALVALMLGAPSMGIPIAGTIGAAVGFTGKLISNSAERRMAEKIIPLATSTNPKDIAYLGLLADRSPAVSKFLDKTSTILQNAAQQASHKPEREGRASGGKVSRDIAPLVGRLMGLANQAKKATDNNTKPLLDAPDASIVKALRVANQAI